MKAGQNAMNEEMSSIERMKLGSSLICLKERKLSGSNGSSKSSSIKMARFRNIKLDLWLKVLAIFAQLELQVYQLDVKSAFLNGEIEEEVYVEQPEGFIIKGKEEKVCRLNKDLYGLKQPPRAWNSKINSYFIENGFNCNLSESSLYMRKVDKDFLIVCLYMDDLIYFGTNSSLVEDFKKKMMKKFDMTDLGLMRYFLGIQVKQSPGRFFLSQEKYIDDLLKKFNMSYCKPISTPMALNEKLHVHDDGGKLIILSIGS
ncbi:UNVERIFIED_CONTAM: Retrovirus-related Pol polyprotein from transposon TNT 1-94 [Sesamum latifolium]|uniref:Retrovirus-related Pol polyprotein from transposon TNT 1-94 n=1 Tax=Sesamum latifolium TaxID=2727402 RepID=A0AAW2Y8B3_9LAMI